MACLSSGDHDAMDAFLGKVLDAYRDGDLNKIDAIAGLVHVIAAIDRGNRSEAVGWFEAGLANFKEMP